MKIMWEPNWYELDQTIIVGDKDFFYLEKDNPKFAENMVSPDDREVVGKIVKITHHELGELLGIYTIGLSYKFFLKDGTYIQVDAEQDIGEIEHPDDCNVNNWFFQVEVDILEITGHTSLDRLKRLGKMERMKLEKERKERYKRLLKAEKL
ncbi:hypothetical protein A8F94_15600 [Bacillus sp. FJAT-27225]|uniref:hypothetical protein n=1 Tax=Bacillus sp. FJAT-27225 TaxID=1743144 RepID=UPI00080C2F96|nr:hypothetical protein [Bacillus sp. FJAT-27225]OCA84146.1 hypothetical protein A8F94_15600 [Bacillus sp. FJAT-27225]